MGATLCPSAQSGDRVLMSSSSGEIPSWEDLSRNEKLFVRTQVAKVISAKAADSPLNQTKNEQPLLPSVKVENADLEKNKQALKENGAVKESIERRESVGSDILSGVWEMMSVTTHERIIIKRLWSLANKRQHQFSDAICSRIIAKDPSTASFFKSKKKVLNYCGMHSFFNRLINEMNMDNDEVISACQELGELHASAILRPKSPFPRTPTKALETGEVRPIPFDLWERVSDTSMQELKLALKEQDRETKEIFLVTWRHFVGAVVDLIREGYENRLVNKDYKSESLSIESIP